MAAEGPVAKRARPTCTADALHDSLDPNSKQRGAHTLTIKEIATDKLTRTAEKNWSAATRQPGAVAPAFQPELVVRIYNDELGGASDKAPSLKRVMLLEISQYLEHYLWPNYQSSSASPEHVLSIVRMVNEKFREGVPAWTCFHTREAVFKEFFHSFVRLKDARPLRMHERTAYLVFTIHALQSLEDKMVRDVVLPLVSLPLWHVLSPGRAQLEYLQSGKEVQDKWDSLTAREAKKARELGDAHVPPALRPETRFLTQLLDEFLDTVVTAADISEPMDASTTEAAAAAPAAASAKAKAAVVGPSGLPAGPVLFCERFVEFLIDLLSQYPTRRFTHALFEDRAILVKARMSPLYKHPGANLFRQLVDLLQFYMAFPINQNGDPVTDDEMTAAHYEKVCQLQRLAFKHWPQLRELSLSNCGTVERRDVLRRSLAALSEAELRLLVTAQLRLVAEDDTWAQDPAFLIEVMLSTFERRRLQRDVINEMPLYPTETILWDENQIPSDTYTGEGCLALPKLNLQFLTTHDYLLRNFHLFRLEATYEIREDVSDVLSRVGAYYDEDGKVKFAGWARMALPVSSFKIVEVAKPNVGEAKPAAVTADIVLDTRPLRGDVRAEWDGTKEHDVLFLLTLRPPTPEEAKALRAAGSSKANVAERFGLIYARGCEVLEVKDEGGRLMNDFTGRIKRDEWKPPEGLRRTLTVALDTAQYQLDMNALAKNKGSEDPYGTFNLLLRRKPKENNFKAVLESIRDLMNEEFIVPQWLHNIFLGYGDPSKAQRQNMEGQLQVVDYKDTFLDEQHVRESFPQYEVEVANTSEHPTPRPPFRVTFPVVPKADEDTSGKKKKKSKRKTAAAAAVPAPDSNGAAAATTAAAPSGAPPSSSSNSGTAAGNATSAADAPPAVASTSAPANGEVVVGSRPVLRVESYTPPDPGPYPQNQPRQNHVRFTPVQVEAITAGVNPGLTMVVGPPGTGKTDTAVQIMNVLYHNEPAQRTLLITHSNQALNDLFQKIMERDIPARYLLRLGMGEQELETEQDFSRVGRVNAILARRLELLAEVEKMARQFGVAEDVAYTCETAGYFWLLHVLSRWEKFLAGVERLRTAECVGELFPFKEFFADAPQPIFASRSYDKDLERARGCFRHLRTMFTELEECRAFELLKGQADRVNYLMTKQAKIVAMTCTHAALKRREFLQLAFKYDNLLMEEAAQILEIETFIPMLLQDGDVSRLKRVILIGDHQQLPPVVKNMAFQKYSHLDQSLFTRFIRLGTPYVELNAQGRARPSLAKLYNWRYRQLGDLPGVTSQPRFLGANAGFAFTYQLVDVQDFNGVGESEPTPYFYQNLGEAEYVVSVYMFMRLMGYPAAKISILTTYNGQKHLLRDVIERRCAANPMFGRPHKVTTVDKYQGQQNDYVLLSLVRSRVVGHLRDVRRLVVAMSRARLGTYVFGRAALFGNCYELAPTFRQLLQRPTALALVKGESYGKVTRQESEPGQFELIADVHSIGALVGLITAEQAAAAQQQQQPPPAGQPPAGPPPRAGLGAAALPLSAASKMAAASPLAALTPKFVPPITRS